MMEVMGMMRGIGGGKSVWRPNPSVLLEMRPYGGLFRLVELATRNLIPRNIADKTYLSSMLLMQRCLFLDG
jgi:hypothetical protein